MDGTHAQIPSLVEVQNTLFVSKNGNDDTAQRNDWTQPFLTIASASNQAVAGDTIYVFAGTYVELVDFIKSDVHYHFEDGTLVQSPNRCVSDYGLAKNIIITGYGRFQQTAVNFSFGAVDVQNPDTTLSVKCKEIIGNANGLNIGNCSSFNVEADLISTLSQYAVNIRGNSKGELKFNEVVGLNNSMAMMFRNLGTDLVARRIIVSGNKVNGTISAFGQANMTFINCNNTEFVINDIVNEHSAGTGGLIFTDPSGAGKLRWNNILGNSALGYGINGQNCTMQFSSCDIEAPSYAMAVRNNCFVYARNSWFKQVNDVEADGGTIAVVGASGMLDLDSCVVQTVTTAVGRKCLNFQNSKSRIRNSKFVASNTQTESIGNSLGAPFDVSVEGQCATNIAVSPLLTNIVAGTNIVVDINVGTNLNTFL